MFVRRAAPAAAETSAAPREARAWLAAEIAFPLLAVLAMYALTGLRETGFNNYVYLADAWRHGRLWIEFPGSWIDAIPYHGRAYIIEGPTPAILIFPFVCLAGLQAKQTLLSVALGALGVFAALRLCRNLGVPLRAALALTAFLFFGTSFYVCAAVGAVWYLAHVSAVTFSLLALAELYGRGRGWCVALWALAAMFSRLPLLAAVPVYFAVLGFRPEPRRNLIGFAGVCLAVAPLSIWYNEARFGTVADVGFTLFYHIMTPHPTGPPFSLDNLDMQLDSFFRSAPPFIATFPWVTAGMFGTSLQWQSPALLLALLARTRASLPLWLTAALTALPSFFYFDIGGMQFGMRHALDFEAFLFALMALGVAHKGIPLWGKVLIGYSIAFGIATAPGWYAHY